MQAEIVMGANDEIMEPVQLFPNELRQALQDVADAFKLVAEGNEQTGSYCFEELSRRIGQHVAWSEDRAFSLLIVK